MAALCPLVSCTLAGVGRAVELEPEGHCRLAGSYGLFPTAWVEDWLVLKCKHVETMSDPVLNPLPWSFLCVRLTHVTHREVVQALLGLCGDPCPCLGCLSSSPSRHVHPP
jgi:hypothetical protein